MLLAFKTGTALKQDISIFDRDGLGGDAIERAVETNRLNHLSMVQSDAVRTTIARLRLNTRLLADDGVRWDTR